MFTPNNPWYGRVQLLMRVLPQIAQEPVFAVKGGTAINLFIRDMPRLSVDIDLAYLPLEPREEALVNIESAMRRISEQIEKSLPGSQVSKQQTKSGEDYKLLVRAGSEEIIIETSPVMRGTVTPPTEREVRTSVEDEFGYASIAVSSFEDLYAGKLCAALDRQHPRDLFDVKVLYENEGLGQSLHEVFLVYLLCGSRPVAEMLAPNYKDLRAVYENQFLGMSLNPVSLEELEAIRERMVQDIHRLFTDAHKQFLMNFKRGEPDWTLIMHSEAEQLPAIQWKLQNIRRIPPKKHREALGKLERILCVL
jgi:predicted nucleotidyltransferase component of viral defense system